MANLTVTVDEAVLRQARIRALQHGTSVNALLREYLEAYAGDPARARAVSAFLKAARKSGAGSRGKGRTWTRDDAHEI